MDAGPAERFSNHCQVVEKLDKGGKHTMVEISSGRTWIHIDNLAFRQMFV